MNENTASLHAFGVKRLLLILGKQHSRSSQIIDLERRLSENIQNTRLYGENEGITFNYTKIITELTNITMAETSETFTDFCKRQLTLPEPEVESERSIAEIQNLLSKFVLDSSLKPQLKELAAVLVGVISKQSTDPSVDKVTTDSLNHLHEVIQKLAGREVTANNSIISFGENSQNGDITIRDVARGNIINLNVSYTNQSSELKPVNSEEKNGSEQKQPWLNVLGLLATFATFFLFLGCIGYLQANTAKGNSKYIPVLIGEKLTMERDEQGIFIRYQCPGLPMTYYIDNNELHDEEFLVKSEPYTSLADTVAPAFTDETYVQAIAIGTGTLALKDAFELVTNYKGRYDTRGRVTKAVAAILGGISGYNLGYSIAAQNHPSCDSDEVRKSIRDDITWKEWVRWQWAAEYKPAYKMESQIATCLVMLRMLDDADLSSVEAVSSQLKGLRRQITTVGYNITTSDFDRLEQLNKDIRNIDGDKCPFRNT